MPWQHYRTVRVRPREPGATKRRYSVTSHVLSYRKCSRQYGFMGERRYEPALAVQMYYGTVIHQVLDRAHAHYGGLIDPALAGAMPTDDDIEQYFNEVDSGLRSRRIYAVPAVKASALKVLRRFNALEGPVLYPRVLDTECRLQADQGSYILHGNVDVLVQPGATDAPEVAASTLAGVELWDYKGTRKPSIDSRDYRDYRFQMQVYAQLYLLKTGSLPTRGVLYFLNELADDPAPTARPVNATVVVGFDQASVDEAVQTFRATVADIERCRMARNWPDPGLPPTEETCDACDLRWNCQAARGFGRAYGMIYP